MSKQQYDNNNRGVLFKNDRKTQENHPDYKGQCEVDGIQLWLSAWIKEGEKGKFMSLSFTPKEEQQAPMGAKTKPPAGKRYDETDDIPF